MVRIGKGNLVNTVPRSSFDNFFKSQGWVILEGDNAPSNPIVEKEKKEEKIEEQVVENSDSETSDDEWDEVLDEFKDEEVEKPLSEMNKSELIEKANSLGVDISNLNTNKQLREAIKSFNV